MHLPAAPPRARARVSSLAVRSLPLSSSLALRCDPSQPSRLGRQAPPAGAPGRWGHDKVGRWSRAPPQHHRPLGPDQAPTSSSTSRERVFSSDAGVEEVQLGLYILRGDNMCRTGPPSVHAPRRALCAARRRLTPFLHPPSCPQRRRGRAHQEEDGDIDWAAGRAEPVAPATCRGRRRQTGKCTVCPGLSGIRCSTSTPSWVCQTSRTCVLFSMRGKSFAALCTCCYGRSGAAALNSQIAAVGHALRASGEGRPHGP